MLTPDLVRAALADPAPPPASARLQLRDEAGAVVVRPIAPPAGQAVRPAAVLVLLYPAPDDLIIVFTQRAGNLPSHAGQVSFPGGRVEAGDPSHLDTALRETEEELGVDARAFEHWGPLQPIYVPPTNYYVYPFVVYTDRRPAFSPNPAEVEAVLEIPLSTLLRPESFTTVVRELQGQRIRIPGFRHGSAFIWGATAFMLEQLLVRVAARLQAPG